MWHCETWAVGGLGDDDPSGFFHLYDSVILKHLDFFFSSEFSPFCKSIELFFALQDIFS